MGAESKPVAQKEMTVEEMLLMKKIADAEQEFIN